MTQIPNLLSRKRHLTKEEKIKCILLSFERYLLLNGTYQANHEKGDRKQCIQWYSFRKLYLTSYSSIPSQELPSYFALAPLLVEPDEELEKEFAFRPASRKAPVVGDTVVHPFPPPETPYLPPSKRLEVKQEEVTQDLIILIVIDQRRGDYFSSSESSDHRVFPCWCSCYLWSCCEN